jgi:hypothetical protein
MGSWKGFPQSLEKEKEVIQRRHHDVQRELQKKYKEVIAPCPHQGSISAQRVDRQGAREAERERV